MDHDEHDASAREHLEDDPLDRMEREDREEDVEQAWEDSEIEEGEAPTG